MLSICTRCGTAGSKTRISGKQDRVEINRILILEIQEEVELQP